MGAIGGIVGAASKLGGGKGITDIASKGIKGISKMGKKKKKKKKKAGAGADPMQTINQVMNQAKGITGIT